MQFSDIPKEYTLEENSEIVLIPLPYSHTNVWSNNADKGPQAIIDASVNLEWYDIETKAEVYKKGIFIAPTPILANNFELMTKQVQDIVSMYLNDKKMPVCIGGEHSVSIGAIKAFAEKYSNLSVLQLDAHADIRREYNGSKFNSACVMHHVKDICPIVQVGIRSLSSEEKEYIQKDRVYFAHDIYNNDNWMSNASSQLKRNVYITIDLDVFDISIMPSVSNPEPGGLMWYQVLSFLRKVSNEHTIVGFDIVELCPNNEQKAANALAAKLLYKLLNYTFY